VITIILGETIRETVERFYRYNIIRPFSSEAEKQIKDWDESEKQVSALVYFRGERVVSFLTKKKTGPFVGECY